MEAIICKVAAYLLVVVTVALLVGPVIYYLLCGWVARRRDILGSFTKDAIRKYFDIFFFADFGKSKQPKPDFAALYKERFGRQHFVIPGLCLLAVSIFLLSLVSWTIYIWLVKEAKEWSGLPPIAVAAIAGAYMWVLYDLIGRAQQRDLVPANLFRASFRLLVAVPVGFAIATLFKDQVGLAMAVFIGAFPTRTLLTICRRLAASKLDAAHLVTEPLYELQDLQGIEKSQAERFRDEGVATILQLAYSDPVDLTIRTNFSLSYVVDCCSQALAWLYFEQKLAEMRNLGPRGGQEIRSLVAELDGRRQSEGLTKAETVSQAKKCMKLVADKLEIDPEALERAMREIAEDPYTIFLDEVWCATAGT